MTVSIDLNPSYLATVERILAEHVPECEVRAFGSRATWTAKDYSDLDLAVVGKGPLDRITLGRLKESFEESNLPMRVDVLDWHSISESFQREIGQDYVVVQEGVKQATTEEWCEVTLGEVLTLQRGFDLPTTQRKLGSYPVIASTGPVGTHDEAMVRGPGVVIGRSGSLGGGQFVEHDFWPLNTTLWVKDFKGNDPRFCYYLLKSIDLGQFNVGSGVPTLNRNHVHPFPVALPPFHEQRAIAHVLGTLDDKIELNRRMNETLEAMARALFKSWFVDFDPVRAKIEGRWRRGESLPGLPTEHYDLFPDRLVDSELGEIPDGWRVRAFETLLNDVIGGDWGKETPDESHTEPVSIIRGTDLPAISNGGVGSVPLRFTTEKKAERRMLKDGDIIIEVSGGSPTQSTGRSLMITQDVLNRFPGIVVCASFCRRFRSNSWRDGLLASRHLDFLQSTGKMWDYQLQSTGIANFQTTRFLKEEKVIWPGESLLTTFAEIVGPIVRQTSRNENMTLASQRDALLPLLVSGELEVGE